MVGGHKKQTAAPWAIKTGQIHVTSSSTGRSLYINIIIHIFIINNIFPTCE